MINPYHLKQNIAVIEKSPLSFPSSFIPKDDGRHAKMLREVYRSIYYMEHQDVENHPCFIQIKLSFLMISTDRGRYGVITSGKKKSIFYSVHAEFDDPIYWKENLLQSIQQRDLELVGDLSYEGLLYSKENPEKHHLHLIYKGMVRHVKEPHFVWSTYQRFIDDNHSFDALSKEYIDYLYLKRHSKEARDNGSVTSKKAQ